jgi:hypothetical protein
MVIYFSQRGHCQPGEEARLDKDGNKCEHSCDQPERFPTDIRQRFRWTEHAEQNQQRAAQKCHPVTGELLACYCNVCQDEHDHGQNHKSPRTKMDRNGKKIKTLKTC